MWGSLRVRLLAALVLLPVGVAVAVTFLAVRQFRADKELYVHDLSAQTVELVARNLSTRLESLTLLASLQLSGAATAPIRADRLRRVARAERPAHGPFAVQNISEGVSSLLQVHARGSRENGSLRFAVPPTTLLDLSGYQGPTKLFVVNREGQLILHPDGVRGRGSRRSLVEALGLFKAGQPRLGSREVALDGEASLVAYAHVGDGLAVLQTIAKSRVFAAAAPLVRSAIIASAVVVGLAVLIALMLAGTVIRPVRKMVKQAEAIGRGEFGVAVETSTKGAVGALAGKLNNMSTALHEREQQVALMQRQVLRSERVNTAGRIIAAIAKELGQPIDACVELASECEKLETTNVKLRDRHARIARESNRAANILQNLTRVGGDAEQAEQQPLQPVELDMLVSDVLVSSGALLRQKRIAVAAALESGGRVMARPEELRSLLLDLLLFLSEHAEPGKPAKVSLGDADDEGEIVIDIEFQGPTWSEEQRRQLVDPYAAACDAAESHTGGTLMLAVSAMVLEEQGGRLEVDELEGRNRLRTFLPRAAPPAPPPIPPKESADAAAG